MWKKWYLCQDEHSLEWNIIRDPCWKEERHKNAVLNLLGPSIPQTARAAAWFRKIAIKPRAINPFISETPPTFNFPSRFHRGTSIIY